VQYDRSKGKIRYSRFAFNILLDVSTSLVWCDTGLHPLRWHTDKSTAVLWKRL